MIAPCSGGVVLPVAYRRIHRRGHRAVGVGHRAGDRLGGATGARHQQTDRARLHLLVVRERDGLPHRHHVVVAVARVPLRQHELRTVDHRGLPAGQTHRGERLRGQAVVRTVQRRDLAVVGAALAVHRLHEVLRGDVVDRLDLQVVEEERTWVVLVAHVGEPDAVGARLEVHAAQRSERADGHAPGFERGDVGAVQRFSLD